MPYKELSGYCHYCDERCVFRKETPNNTLHAILTIFSCFLWGIFWVIDSLIKGMRHPYCSNCGTFINWRPDNASETYPSEQDSSGRTPAALPLAILIGFILLMLFGLGQIAYENIVAKKTGDEQESVEKANLINPAYSTTEQLSKIEEMLKRDTIPFNELLDARAYLTNIEGNDTTQKLLANVDKRMVTGGSSANSSSFKPVTTPTISSQNANKDLIGSSESEGTLNPAIALINFKKKIFKLPTARKTFARVESGVMGEVLKIYVTNYWYRNGLQERRQITQLLANIWEQELGSRNYIVHIYDSTGTEIAGTRFLGGVWVEDK